MAMMLSTESVTSKDALAILAGRFAAGHSSVVLDHGVRNSPVLIPGLAAVPEADAEKIGLLDFAHGDGRWHALMDLRPEDLAEDLAELAQALRIWLGGCPDLEEEAALASNTGAIETPVALQDFLIWVYYDARGAKVQSALKARVGAGVWRIFLRKLGEGRASVFQDPWFGRLFLGGGQRFPLELPLVFVNLQAPRTPLDVARRAAAVVIHRALVVHSRRDPSASLDLAIVLADGAAIVPAIEAIATDFGRTRGGAGRDINVRLLVLDIDAVQEPEPTGLASTIVELSRLKHSRDASSVDSEIYRPLPGTVDELHRPDFLKGIMYGFDAFCRIEEGADLPETLRVLQEEGITVGAAAPLLDLPDDL